MRTAISSWKYLLLILTLGVMALLIIDFNSRMVEWRRLSMEKDVIAAKATQFYATQQVLETKIARATSPAGVSGWAREEQHMAQPGDVLIVPVEGGGNLPSPTETPSPPPRTISNLELWLSLFFDWELP
jgi:hypothetical protein